MRLPRVDHPSEAVASDPVNTSLVVLVALTGLVAIVVLLVGGPPLVGDGLKKGAGMLVGIAPQMLLGFALAGLVSVVIPAPVISRHLGAESGLLGLAIATVAGSLTPGGPWVQFPLVVTLANAGVGPGALTAYLTAWSLTGFSRILSYELPLLGLNFTVTRVALSLLIPIPLGLAVGWILTARQP